MIGERGRDGDLPASLKSESLERLPRAAETSAEVADDLCPLVDTMAVRCGRESGWMGKDGEEGGGRREINA